MPDLLLLDSPPTFIAAPSDADVFRSPSRYLEGIWHTYFADVPCVNQVNIAYGQAWKNRLGSIRLSPDTTISFIKVNGLLQLPQIPDYILITTIAHELAHYAHGFGSPRPPLYQHPHANRVVELELKRRGLGETMRMCNEWVDSQWFASYEEARAADWPGLPAICRPPSH